MVQSAEKIHQICVVGVPGFVITVFSVFLKKAEFILRTCIGSGLKLGLDKNVTHSKMASATCF